MTATLSDLLAGIRACRLCRDTPEGARLPHEPRPVVQLSSKAQLAIFGQAPGVRVHASGRPFADPSGVRLRQWLGIGEETFYDEARVAIVPMGFCFPGHDSKGGDLPPRSECALRWRAEVMAALPDIRTTVLVGAYAQSWHLEGRARGLTQTVARWREFAPRYFPTPHPSWRNNAWLKKNSWFENELLPTLKEAVAAVLAGSAGAN